MEEIFSDDYKNIKGWGVDADPKNDPTYPIRKRTDEEHEGYSWDRPSQQPVDMEVLHSNERPNVPAVFGTASPPSGLSGMIRRFAFNYSENSYAHWLPLLLADRVNEYEGILDDLSKGRIPNIFAESGWNAEWKYNRNAFVKKAVITTAVASAMVGLLILTNRKKESII